MDIYKIKKLTAETEPYYFTRKSLNFFGQTMKSFTVERQSDGRYKISAPIIDPRGNHVSNTVRFFNPENNKLEHF